MQFLSFQIQNCQGNSICSINHDTVCNACNFWFSLKIKRREIAKILRRHVGQNRKDQNTSIKVSRENEENCNDEKYGFIL